MVQSILEEFNLKFWISFSSLTFSVCVPAHNALEGIKTKRHNPSQRLLQIEIFHPRPSEVAEVAEVKQPWNSKRQKIFDKNIWKLDEIQNLASATSKMTSWQPLDLNDLGTGSVIFFKNYIFTISASSWGKWAIARISSQSFKIQNFVYFIAASEDRELKTGICKSLNRKPSNSSFFSA